MDCKIYSVLFAGEKEGERLVCEIIISGLIGFLMGLTVLAIVLDRIEKNNKAERSSPVSP
jgi:hypothetical protein